MHGSVKQTGMTPCVLQGAWTIHVPEEGEIADDSTHAHEGNSSGPATVVITRTHLSYRISDGLEAKQVPDIKLKYGVFEPSKKTHQWCTTLRLPLPYRAPPGRWERFVIIWVDPWRSLCALEGLWKSAAFCMLRILYLPYGTTIIVIRRSN